MPRRPPRPTNYNRPTTMLRRNSPTSYLAFIPRPVPARVSRGNFPRVSRESRGVFYSSAINCLCAFSYIVVLVVRRRRISGNSEHLSSLIIARMLMHAFPPAHYTQLDTHGRDTSLINYGAREIHRIKFTRRFTEPAPRVATMRTGVRRNRTRHLVAPRGQPERGPPADSARDKRAS